MAVCRCICRNVRFADLLASATRGEADFARVVNTSDCGSGCGMCLPYILQGLRTGRADQPILDAKTFDALMQECLVLLNPDTQVVPSAQP